MSDISGFGGSFSFTGTGVDCNVTEWSATMDADDITIPAAFAGIWKTHSLGQGRITGSLNGTLTTSDVPFTVPTGGSDWTSTMGVTLLILTATTGHTITIGGAIFSNVRITRPHNGVGTISADFRTTGGAITVSAWA